ncbi:MAG: hypothetical protein GYB53_13260 [Rhodobacteraceae bacterium]|nr:hypothetical protein [Paracoccaceae bacterium]MBR9821233.1 hypothetical protein [Paracoccaceae bacterium]
MRPALFCLLLLAPVAAGAEAAGDPPARAPAYGSAYQQERLRLEQERTEALRDGDLAELAKLDRQRRLLLLRAQDGLRPRITPGQMPPTGSTSGLKIPGITSP